MNEAATSTESGPSNPLRNAPKTAEFSRGMGWISEGWQYFTATPGLLIGMFLTMVVLSIVLSFVPLLSNLLAPYMMAGFMVVANRIHHGEEAEFADLFAGFKEKLVPLLLVGVLFLVGTLVVMVIAVIVMMILGGAGAIIGGGSGSEEAAAAALGMGMLLAVLVALLFTLPLVMALWFAPALVMFNDLDAVEAMKLSFMGCLQNVLPFLLYGIVLFVLMILGMIPLFLGLLVVLPLMYTSTYAAYREIYVQN
jgi:hypothetical protein